MTAHHTVPSAGFNEIQIAKDDDFLSLVYRAESEADLIALIQQMGITDPEHQKAMLGLSKLALIVLRNL